MTTALIPQINIAPLFAEDRPARAAVDAAIFAAAQEIGFLTITGINIASTAGWHGYPLRTPYAASKSAVIGLTRSLAMELGPWGIRANVICPGSVAGDRMDRVITAEAREKGVTEAVIRSRYTESNSLKTFIDAEDIADMACFLASSQARRVTGQVLNVDGNLEAF